MDIKTDNKITIRKAKLSDSKSLTELSVQLGYSASEGKLKERLGIIFARSDNTVLVAEDKDKIIIGWIHAFIALRIESETFAEIGGLVVGENIRGNGIGSLLVGKVEEWAISKGINLMRVRSNHLRKETIKFYLKNDYKTIKTQNVFSKEISKQAAHE